MAESGPHGWPCPQKGNRLLGPSRRAVRIHESRKYQGLESLTQRVVYLPDATDVDDSSRLAQWRLASPEPRGDVRDAVPVIQCRQNREIRGWRLGNPQSRQPDRSTGADRGIKSISDL